MSSRGSRGAGPLPVFLIAAATLMVAPAAQGAHQTYLSLGDSLAFGVGQDQSPGDISDGDRGYVSLFADHLGTLDGHRPHVVNLGLNGETTSSVFSGSGRNDPTLSSTDRNTNYAGLDPVPSQFERFADAVSAELMAGRAISTITLSLGSNDLFLLVQDPAFLAGDEATQTAMLMQTLQDVRTNFSDIVMSLRGYVPGAELYLLGTYDPFGGSLPAAATAIPLLNGVIEGIAEASGSRYVDVYSPFVGNELTYTYIGEGGNVHPSALGYQAMAGALIRSVPEPGSLALVGLGSGGLGLRAWRRHRRRAAVA